jgi:hypothetical protein
VTTVLLVQAALLAYHQVTTLFDFFPFNGARNYSRKERTLECAVNGVLMALPPIGFAFHVRALETFGVAYYFVLFAIELVIWWVPYFTEPSGRWRALYNGMLSLATSDFEKGDALARWKATYQRLFQGTLTLLPPRGDRPVPNLEHMILHAWTLLTALVTAAAYGSG